MSLKAQSSRTNSAFRLDYTQLKHLRHFTFTSEDKELWRCGNRTQTDQAGQERLKLGAATSSTSQRGPWSPTIFKWYAPVLVRVTHRGFGPEAQWKLHLYKLHKHAHNQYRGLPKPLIGTEFWYAQVQEQPSCYKSQQTSLCSSFTGWPHFFFPPHWPPLGAEAATTLQTSQPSSDCSHLQDTRSTKCIYGPKSHTWYSSFIYFVFFLEDAWRLYQSSVNSSMLEFSCNPKDSQ